MSLIANNLEAVRRRIDAACARSGRSPDTVQLLSVSKLQPEAAIREAYAAGLRHFGENYAQELRDKSANLADLPGIRWHAIGPLQTNKAKYVARSAHVFHALDRLDLAQALSKARTGEALQCFVQVNIAGEPSKAGIAPSGLAAFIASVRPLSGLAIVGLTAMPPLVDNPENSRPHFHALAQLARTLELSGLSMGTTADFEAAIEEGATLVRVGTALFGERPA